jgi:hypothetical protein
LKNKVFVRIESLEASIETLDFKIKNLSRYFSYVQNRAWRADRKQKKKELKFYKGIAAKIKNAIPIRELLAR